MRGTRCSLGARVHMIDRPGRRAGALDAPFDGLCRDPIAIRHAFPRGDGAAIAIGGNVRRSAEMTGRAETAADPSIRLEPTRPSLTRRAARRQRQRVGFTNRCRYVSPGAPDRPVGPWIALSLLVALVTACGFPRPPDIGDDATPAGCSRDPDCGGTTPFCVNTACVACRDSTACPATRPVCDLVSHDCRTCVQDSECDSGACDLAAGRCVDQGAILYASPSGGSTDPCTKTSPCSLRRASGLVDTGTPYIVLQPGRYSGGAIFDGKKATIAGHNAILDIVDTASLVNILNSSMLNVRNINLEDHLNTAGMDNIPPGIQVLGSSLTVDNMQSNTIHIEAIEVPSNFNGTLVVGHSHFTGPALLGPQLIIDSCVFHNLALDIFQNDPVVVDGSIQMTNSILIVDTTNKPTFVIFPSTTTPQTNRITHNTFTGGSGITCSASSSWIFDSNIFYNVPMIESENNCQYQYSLSVPVAGIAGTGNITGDPMFKDTANSDFHLKPGSAAIDTANPQDVYTGHDFDGTSRPQGARSDIGAFEYVPAP